MNTRSQLRFHSGDSGACLLRFALAEAGFEFTLTPPEFEIDGRTVVAALEKSGREKSVRLRNGVWAHTLGGRLAQHPDLSLAIDVEQAEDLDVIRFRYRLTSQRNVKLTKRGGSDNFVYARFRLSGLHSYTEVRLSEFDESVHSFRPVEVPLAESAFENEQRFMGPMMVVGGPKHTCLIAYEHGSQVPDRFIEYRLSVSREIAIAAVKGNYYAGRTIGPDSEFETPWFHFGVAPGDSHALAAQYRQFILTRQSQNVASRRPYIFYNTWAFQERNKWWNGKKYLDSMNLDRILTEIEVAHRMGIDVFVLDTGWYDRTGDWRVNRKLFPDDLKKVRALLDSHGMKLGLWFSPTLAAVSSRIMKKMPECRMSWNGKVREPFEVWETEASYDMCLVSRYWETFADELIRLHGEVGVTYYKWDAIGQYGCDSADHDHGGADCTPEERRQCYAFEQVKYMRKVVDKLCAACPEAIVDFDITEGGRSVGLSFLASGKYFLINNGPYFSSLDYPRGWMDDKLWSNVFVYPGPARPRICRAPLDFDKWIPSVLFLTHYLPDDPANSQMINIASLILGQNGIWGDLPAISAEGVERFGKWLGLYKNISADITVAAPVRYGMPGGSPEIHEKINPATGRGAIVMFAGAAGKYEYVSAGKVDEKCVCTPGVKVRRDAQGRAVIECRFDHGTGAQICLFGLEG